MPRPSRHLLALALLTSSSAVLASPVINVEAGYTQLKIEQEMTSSQNRGGNVIAIEQNTYDVGSALRLGAEAVFESGEGLDWLLGASVVYSSDTEQDTEGTYLNSGARFYGVSALDDTWLLGLRGGLRWHHEILPALQLHADAALSLNRLSTSYQDASTSPAESSDGYIAVDAALGLYYNFTPDFAAVLDASGQFDNEYRNLQYTAGLRYSFR
ncbi:MAG: hypothetical protein ACRERR_07145 [Moraxellaceae bacterium]